jgi:hypothetical protein
MKPSGFCQCQNIRERTISQRIGLHITPGIFHRIELRGISGDVFGMKTLGIPQEGLNRLCPVGQETIPDQNQRTFLKLDEEVFQEIENKWGVDIDIWKKAKIETDEVTLR